MKFAIFSLIEKLKIRPLDRIKELYKSNQTWCGVSPVYVDSGTERIFAIACQGKNFHMLTLLGFLS